MAHTIKCKMWNHNMENHQMYFINLIMHCKEKHLGLYKSKRQNLNLKCLALEGKKPRHGRQLNVLQQINDEKKKSWYIYSIE